MNNSKSKNFTSSASLDMSGISSFRHFSGKCLTLGFRMFQYGCAFHVANEYFASLILCSGPSMEPTIESNDLIIVEKISPRLESLSYGDVVVAQSPTDPQQYICKRITAMYGDRVQNGWSEVKVPKGHVWLEGDNRTNSTDSRDYGPVPAALIKGRALFRIFPLGPIPSSEADVDDL